MWHLSPMDQEGWIDWSGWLGWCSPPSLLHVHHPQKLHFSNRGGPVFSQMYTHSCVLLLGLPNKLSNKEDQMASVWKMFTSWSHRGNANEDHMEIPPHPVSLAFIKTAADTGKTMWGQGPFLGGYGKGPTHCENRCEGSLRSYGKDYDIALLFQACWDHYHIFPVCAI